MKPLLWLSLLRYLRHHPWQLALSIIGIALGVAVVLAVDLANASARKSFDISVAQLTGKATHRIEAAAGGVSEDFYRYLRVELGIRAIAPVVTGYASIMGEPDQRFRVLGIDLFADADFRSFANSLSLTQEDNNSNFTGFWAADDVALVPRDAGDAENFTLVAGQQQLTIKVIGRFKASAFDGLIVTDIATAQVLFAQQGFLSHIDVAISDDAAGQQLLALLQAQLPAGLQIQITEQQNQANANLSNAFSLNLSALSLLALLVGMFLIYNTMTFSVVQRRSLLGILRAIGVSRRELFMVILGESLLLGIIGTLLGIVLGIWLGAGLVQLVTRTVGDLYYVLTVNEFYLAPLALAKAILLGILATVVAACLPAHEAAKSPPGTILSRAFLEARWQASVPRVSIIAAVLLLIGVLCLVVFSSLVAGFFGLFLLMLGSAMLVPGLVVLVVRVLTGLLPSNRYILAMAMRGISRHLSRTGVAIAALMVAFSATVGVGVMVDSFRSGVMVWIGDLLQADIYMRPLPTGSSTKKTGIEQAVLEKLATIPGVAETATYRRLDITLNAKPTVLVAAALTEQAKTGYRLLTGDKKTAWQQFEQQDAVMISEPLAYRHNLTVGETINLHSATGEQEFLVAGVFHDYGSEHGRILLNLPRYQHYWQDAGIDSVAIYAAADQDLITLKDQLAAELNPLQALQLSANRDIFNITLKVFDRTFTITNVLRLLAIGVAFVGVLSALMALQLERAREFAILRALGMSHGELGRLVLWQTSAMGFVAGLLSIPLGLVVAAVLVFVINKRSFGWTLPFQIDAMILVQALLLAVIAAVLAGLYPLWRMRKTELIADLRNE